MKQLIERFRCWLSGHSMHLADMGARDDDGFLHWPCQRCGSVQHVTYGLAVNGQITQQRLKAIK